MHASSQSRLSLPRWAAWIIVLGVFFGLADRRWDFAGLANRETDYRKFVLVLLVFIVVAGIILAKSLRASGLSVEAANTIPVLLVLSFLAMTVLPIEGVSNWCPLAIFLFILSALILVAGFKYHRRFVFDANSDFDWLQSAPLTIATVLRLSAKYALLSLIFSFIAAAALRTLSRYAALPERPLPIFEAGWRGTLGLSYYWMLTCAAAMIVPLRDMLRCAKTPGFDVFISYRRLQAETVRWAVEQLIASGVKVWFDEYELLNLPPESRLKAIFKRAVKQSRFGIAFTNSDYAASPWCRLEVRELRRSKGPLHTLEVRLQDQLPARSELDELRGSPCYSSGTMEGLGSFLEQETGLRLRELSFPEKTMSPELYEGKCMGYTFSLDISGWNVEERGSFIPEMDTVQGLTLRRLLDRNLLFMNLYIGPDLERLRERFEYRDKTDRELFNYLRDYAQLHMRRIQGELKGVHLLFHRDITQIGLTYWADNSWRRKYSVILPSPMGGCDAEFVFTFGFTGTFKDLCRHAHLMDALVKSLEWE